jgi:hypothetical protein
MVTPCLEEIAVKTVERGVDVTQEMYGIFCIDRPAHDRIQWRKVKDTHSSFRMKWRGQNARCAGDGGVGSVRLCVCMTLKQSIDGTCMSCNIKIFHF